MRCCEHKVLSHQCSPTVMLTLNLQRGHIGAWVGCSISASNNFRTISSWNTKYTLCFCEVSWIYIWGTCFTSWEKWHYKGHTFVFLSERQWNLPCRTKKSRSTKLIAMVSVQIHTLWSCFYNFWKGLQSLLHQCICQHSVGCLWSYPQSYKRHGYRFWKTDFHN